MPNPPFGSEPWSGSTPADVRSAVLDALRSGASAICVTGGAASGKTALCKELAAGVDDRSFSIGFFDPMLDPKAVLLQLLREFGLGADGAAQTRDSLTATVVRFLKSLKPLGAHVVIVVDDADRVGVDVFTTFLAIARGADDRTLRLVLVGQPDLETRLIDPPLSEFPGTDRRWTRVRLDLDDALVPVIPPESSYVAAIEPEPDVAAPPGASRWMLPALIGLVVAAGVAGAGWWWTARDGTPGSLTPQPAATQTPAAPSATRAIPPPAPTPTAPAASSPLGDPPPAGQPAEQPTVAGAGATQSAAPTRGTAGDGAYRIVVASFRTASRAEQVATSLQSQQLAVATRADGSGTWHQVVAGPYLSIEAARDAQRTLERVGFPDTQISMTTPTLTSAR